ncbi:hypothetical protein FEM03_01240 [Phragmitibacter flavus]|uniref:Uncharacterized protein n=1 Tax=Phragmitibacter flavus TaxID=2576071 RepID=A0A5R8KKF8_9BACT|nr:hypothetical protein [Phragmitibacter flavus]TLD72727.1 hypothetical protein FEM03_01240 [Phragmitibacter flavus]
MNAKLGHILLCALGCETILVAVFLAFTGGMHYADVLLRVSLLIQGPTLVLASLMKPKKPAVSFLIGTGFAVAGIISILAYIVYSYNR